MFFISPSSFSGVFAVPASVADGALKTTSGNFLKVILFVFRHCAEEIDPENIAKNTGVPVGEVNDALYFWTGKGLLTEGEPQPAVFASKRGGEDSSPDKINSSEKRNDTDHAEPSESVAYHGESTDSQKKEEQPEKAVINVRPKTLTYDVICKRVNESAEVRTLFSEAQLRLGRVIGSGDQSSLLLLHDYYGLPVEVILALCEYARTSGKSGNMNYIYTIGVDWSKREIDTLEEADDEFKRLQALDKNWAPFCEITGIKKKKPTQKQSEFLSTWISRYKFTMEMLSCAYEEMSRHTQEMSFPYMNKILTEWYNAGVDTPEKAKEREIKFTEEKAQKKALMEAKKKTAYGTITVQHENGQKPASYDIEKAQQKAKSAVPTLRKKEKR